MIVETIPRISQMMRADLRRAAPEGLTLPHFRALLFLELRPGASVCAVAEHLGLSVSNVSKLLYALAERGLVTHAASHKDRRRVALSLTESGAAMAQTARRIATERLIRLLSEQQVSPGELAGISAAMRSLQRVLPAGVAPDAVP